MMRKREIWFKAVSLAALGVLFCAPISRGQQLTTLNLMPVPAKVQMGNDSLKIDGGFTVALAGHTDARLTAAVERFTERLAKQTGLLIAVKPVNRAKATLEVHTDRDSKPVQEVGEDESYALEVT